MKSFFAIALATTALISTAPSQAQNSLSGQEAISALRSLLGNQNAAPSETDLIDQERRLAALIEESSNQQRIDRGQADRAYNELRSIHDKEDNLRAEHGQLTPQDHDYLRDQLANLDREVDQMREATLRSNGNQRADNPASRSERGGSRGDFWDRAPTDLDEREAWLDREIHDGMGDGSLDRSEARRGLQQLRSIRRDEARFLRRDRGELSDQHQTDLADRLDEVGQQLRWNGNPPR